MEKYTYIKLESVHCFIRFLILAFKIPVYIAQSGERRLVDLDVAGSIPGRVNTKRLENVGSNGCTCSMDQVLVLRLVRRCQDKVTGLVQSLVHTHKCTLS